MFAPFIAFNLILTIKGRGLVGVFKFSLKFLSNFINLRASSGRKISKVQVSLYVLLCYICPEIYLVLTQCAEAGEIRNSARFCAIQMLIFEVEVYSKGGPDY